MQTRFGFISIEGKMVMFFGKIRFLLFSIFRLKSFGSGYFGPRTKIVKEKKTSVVFGRSVGFSSDCAITIRNGASLRIGNNFGVNKNLFMACRNKIEIGDNVIIGPNVVIVDNNHDYKADNMRNNYVLKYVIIGNNVWIGANCIILPGVSIGDNCVIAAGTIVTKSVSSNTLIYNKTNIIEKKF